MTDMTNDEESVNFDDMEYSNSDESDQDEGDTSADPGGKRTSEDKEKKKAHSKERRKERNKLLARKSRQRVKGELETLKQKLLHLMTENQTLKRQITSMALPEVTAAQLMQGEIILPDSLQLLVRQLISRTAKAVSTKRMEQSSFCISNAIAPELPLVYASAGFCRLTGYSYSEIVGRNCRFLQGPGTDQAEVQRIRTALQEGRDITSVLLNYRKDGTVFWNQVKLAHLKDQTGRSFLIVGIQTKLKPLQPNLQPEAVMAGMGIRAATRELLLESENDHPFKLPRLNMRLNSDNMFSSFSELCPQSSNAEDMLSGVFDDIDPAELQAASAFQGDTFAGMSSDLVIGGNRGMDTDDSRELSHFNLVNNTRSSSNSYSINNQHHYSEIEPKQTQKRQLRKHKFVDIAARREVGEDVTSDLGDSDNSDSSNFVHSQQPLSVDR